MKFCILLTAETCTAYAVRWTWGRLQLKRDGTRWRTGGEVKGELANGVGSQYPSHYLGTCCNPALLPLMRTPRLPVVDWTDAPANLNGLVRFAESRNLVSARVPSHFNWPLLIMTVDRPVVFGSCLQCGKPNAPCLSPVTVVLHLKIH